MVLKRLLRVPIRAFTHIFDIFIPILRIVFFLLKIKEKTKKWHSESADPAKALNLSLAKQTNKQTKKKFWPQRGSNSRPSGF